MKRVILVGATDGIGKALAEHYASEGSWVAIVGRDAAKLETLRADLAGRYPDATVKGVVCDLTDRSRLEPAYREAVSAIGHCDLFIYCAGILVEGDGEASDGVADALTFDVNTVSAALMLGLAANDFRIARRGTLVGISSIAGDRGRKRNPAYCASKSALTTYLEGLRNRLAPFGVKVVTVKPGYVSTKMIAGKKGVFWAAPVDVAARTIARRVARGHEVFYVYRRWALLGLALHHVPRFVFKKAGPP
jgi:short-subunit dehydrogenase